MKLRTIIENVGGRYGAQIEAYDFSAGETEKMIQFGEPVIELGGVFAGTVNRPGVPNTTIAIAGNGSGATAVPIVQNGSVTGATVTAPGTGYTTAPVTISGGGANATAVSRFGAVSITLASGGTGHAANDVLSYSSGVVGDTALQIRVLTVNGSGVILTAEILDAGNFASAPSTPISTFSSSGGGSGASINIVLGVVEVRITAGGAGYDLSPLSLTFTLDGATRRLKTDSPFKQVFDLEDDSNAAGMAQLWAQTIVSRCISAKLNLMDQTTEFSGESVITV